MYLFNHLLILNLLLLSSGIFAEGMKLGRYTLFLIIVVFISGVFYLAAFKWGKLVSLLPSIIENKKINLQIFLASFLALFVELALIRYQSSSLAIFGYFKNITLLSCFFGLGIGFYLGKLNNKNFLPLFITMMALQMVLFCGMNYLMPAPHYLVNENPTISIDVVRSASQAVYTLSFLGIIFLITVLTCIPLGHYASNLMSKKPPLVSYGINLLGSLAGVLVFLILCNFHTPPYVWFSIAFLIVFYFLYKNGKSLLISVIFSFIFLLGQVLDPDTFINKNLKIYSPYQLLIADFSKINQFCTPLFVSVSHNFHQLIFDLRPDNIKNKKCEYWSLDLIADYYNNPYKIKPMPENVLIVGAGTGNDVAAALRGGAKSIDAVEIDPGIAELGKLFHPERPYQSSKVMLHINDARTYMKSCKKKYDLIIYGFLDAQGTLSSFSNVRLDSFVYTVEAFKEARSLLKDNGFISLSFGIKHHILGNKIFKMLQSAFNGEKGKKGEKPICLESKDYGGTIFLIGPGLKNIDVSTLKQTLYLKDVTSIYDKDVSVDMSTDDWPFLYMSKRVYPLTYFILVIWLLFLSFCVLKQFFKSVSLSDCDPQFFFLGAGFMLIETKCITELGLEFGNTWQVIAVIISFILLLAFLANTLMFRVKKINLIFCYCVLLLVIFAEAFFKVSLCTNLLPGNLVPYFKLFVLTVPIFFSGLIFSSEMKIKNEISTVLAFNLFGAMFGGFLEYNAMSIGYHGLSWIALFVYFLAMASRSRVLKN